MAGISVLVIGATGSGKSSLARKAMKKLGSGIVVMAPGYDEYNSYTEMHDDPNYVFKGFDDADFYPSLGERKVGGLNALIRWQREIFKEVQDQYLKDHTLKYKVIVDDTVSNMGVLAHNAALVANGLDKAPAAQSPDGAAFYSTVKQFQEQMFHVPRALKGFGVHWIALSHQVERDTTDVNNAAQESKSKSIVPNVPGGFKDVLPGYFDVVAHAGVKIEGGVAKHWLQTKPSARRPTKSRLGTLNDGKPFLNSWDGLMELIEKAQAERTASNG